MVIDGCKWRLIHHKDWRIWRHGYDLVGCGSLCCGRWWARMVFTLRNSHQVISITYKVDSFPFYLYKRQVLAELTHEREKYLQLTFVFIVTQVARTLLCRSVFKFCTHAMHISKKFARLFFSQTTYYKHYVAHRKCRCIKGFMYWTVQYKLWISRK